MSHGIEIKAITIFLLKGGQMPFSENGGISYPAHVGAVLDMRTLNVDWDMLSPPPKHLNGLVTTRNTPNGPKYTFKLNTGENVLLGLRVIFGDIIGNENRNWHVAIKPLKDSPIKGLSPSTLRRRRSPIRSGRKTMINFLHGRTLKPGDNQEAQILVSNSGVEPVLIQYGWSPVEFVFCEDDGADHTFKPRLIKVNSIQELSFKTNGHDVHAIALHD